MRKTFLLLAFFIFCGASLQAQDEKPELKLDTASLLKHYQMKYIFGRKYNDMNITTDALYGVLALFPNNDSLKLNLGYLYLDNSKFTSSLFVAADLLGRNPNNLGALNLSAISYENLGLIDKAISTYESMYLIDNSMSTLYQVAALQFDGKKFIECITNCNIMIGNEQSKEIKLAYNKSQTEKIEVPLITYAYYLKGMAENENGNKLEAESNLDKALEITPGFDPAVQAKENLNKPAEEE